MLALARDSPDTQLRPGGGLSVQQDALRAVRAMDLPPSSAPQPLRDPRAETRHTRRDDRPTLTPAQRKVLRILTHTRPQASMRQIGRKLAIQVSAVHGHLVALERKGYIRRGGGRSRAIDVLKSDFSLPLAGKLVDGRFVPAGGT